MSCRDALSLAFSLLLVSVLCTSAEQNANSDLPLEVYKKLLAVPSNVYGPIRKAGLLPADRWSMPEFLSTHSATYKAWSQDVSKQHSVPPLSFICGIWVNHGYKLIYVRNKKAASTAVVWVSGKKCTSTSSKEACWTKVEKASTFTEAGITPEEAWKTYTVFTVTRNPWSRAASGFTYLATLDSSRCWRALGFSEFCKEPFLLSKKCDENSQCCLNSISFRVHVEPFARCAKTEMGDFVLDHVLRYESLSSDWDDFRKVLNERPGLPKLNQSMAIKHQGLYLTQGAVLQQLKQAAAAAEEVVQEVQRSSRYAEDFQACGPPCVAGLAAFYREDIETFGYTVPKEFDALRT